MSVSSYSSECSSSSSSSSSGSSSSTSSDATGQFSSSSKASFSSCSTIVEAQPTVRPFGYPVFNYFWLERRSKTFPEKKYYWNFKSHAVVWERPVPKDVPLPIYTNAQTFVQQNTSDNEDILVSEPEDVISRKRRLAVKLRNRRLAVEEKDDKIQVLSVKKTIKSKKMLETFWKLYRYPGESIVDVKTRLLSSIENTVKIKTELDSTHGEYNANSIMDPSLLSLKQEPPFNEDNLSCTLNDSVNIIKKDEDEDSDSDPEHVSRLIKEEYMFPYEGTDIEEEEYDTKGKIYQVPDEEMEKDSEDEEDEVDEDSEDESVNFSDIHQDTYKSNNLQNTNEMFESESDNFEYEYEVPYLQEDLLNVEINEDNNGKIYLPIDDDVIIEHVNWNFDQSSETINNSALTCSAITSKYGAPKVKQIRSKHLLSSNRKKRKIKTQKKKRVQKLIIKKEPCFDVKSEPESSGDEKPIICDRYGTRTYNYNHPPKVKLPHWQVYTKLSSGSDNESSENSSNKFNKVSTAKRVQKVTRCEFPATQRKDEGALELRNWFPKPRSRKRKNNRAVSDSSWCASDLSDCTSVDEFDRHLIRMKREKRSSSSEREAQCPVLENSIAMTIKNEIQEDSSVEQIVESEILGSSTLPAEPAVDLSKVKAEVSSDVEVQSFAIKVEQNAASDADHSDVDSSSGSSLTCSRSSCSHCAASSSSNSSSSSSDSDSDSDDDPGNKNIVKEHIDI